MYKHTCTTPTTNTRSHTDFKDDDNRTKMNLIFFSELRRTHKVKEKKKREKETSWCNMSHATFIKSQNIL